MAGNQAEQAGSYETKPTSTSPSSTSRSAGSETRHESALRDDATNLRKDLRAVKEDVSSLAHHASEEVRERADRVVHSVQQSGERVGDQVSHYHQSFTRTVRNNPTASIAAALGVGLFLGRIFAGR